MQGKLTERGIIQDMKQVFTPHYNLYQKMYFEKKVQCYKNHSENPTNYYTCLRKIDEEMLKNSDYLRQTFGKIDIDVKNNTQECQSRFDGNEEGMQQCYQNVLKQMKFDSVKVYNKFYEKILSKRKEWSKIK